jgi:Domain of unknown function (DUF4288)
MRGWYSAKLLFEAEVESEGSDDLLCEESIRLVEADDSDDAEQKAAEVGAQAQHEYVNDKGHTVRWHFRRVLDVQDLCESHIVHGMEVFSKMYRRSS